MRIPKSRSLEKKQQIKNPRNGYFNSIWFTKFVNKLMRSGRKSTIEKIVHPILLNFKTQTPSENMDMFLVTSLDQLRLPLEIRMCRKGSEFVPVPFPITLRRQYIKALTSIINEIKNKNNFKSKLQYRILACFCTLNKSKDNLEQNKLFRQKVKLRDYIQENKTNKRFRWV